jgi:peptide/nickel transport system permease protein
MIRAPRFAATQEQTRTLHARTVHHLKRFFAQPLNGISVTLVFLMVDLAVCAPVIAPYSYDEVHTEDQWQPPSATYWLGTDQYGRDVLSRIMYGAQISLTVGIVTVMLAMTIGVTIGATVGYFGGKIDEVIMRVVEIFMAIPGIVLALAVVSVLGPNLVNVIIAIAIYRITQFARVTRGAFFSVMAMDYIEACRAQGMGGMRLVFLHALPNCIGPIVVLATVLLGNVILSEATLSFLGLGIQPPMAVPRRLSVCHHDCL